MAEPKARICHDDRFRAAMVEAGGGILQGHAARQAGAFLKPRVRRHPGAADCRAESDVVDHHDRPQTGQRARYVNHLERAEFIGENERIGRHKAPSDIFHGDRRQNYLSGRAPSGPGRQSPRRRPPPERKARPAKLPDATNAPRFRPKKATFEVDQRGEPTAADRLPILQPATRGGQLSQGSME